MILFATQELSALEPGNGGDDFGFGIPLVSLKAGLHPVVLQDLARGDDELTALAPVRFKAQLGQNLLNVLLAQTRAFAQAELGFDVMRGIQQHAARVVLVASSATGLLQVVFQGAGNVGVYDQAHVLLVHAHAEGVGGDDHLQPAAQKRVLDILFLMGLEAGMKVLAKPLLAAEKVGQVLRLLSAGDEHHRATAAVAKLVGEELVGARELFTGTDEENLKM